MHVILDNFLVHPLAILETCDLTMQIVDERDYFKSCMFNFFKFVHFVKCR